MKQQTPIFGGRAPKQDEAMRRAIAEAVELHAAGRYDEAIAAMTATGALKTATGQSIAGDIHIKRGNPREALKAFDNAVRLAPTAAEPHANRGAALLELGRLEEALAAEDRSLRMRPDYAAAHFNRGNVLKALKRYDDAIAAYTRAAAIQPKLVDALFNRGTALLDLARPLEGLADFERVLTARPRYIAGHVGRARACRDLGRYADGLAAIDAALAIEPGNVDALRMQSALFFADERYEEALAAADALIAHNPADEIAHTARAAALSKLQRWDEALMAADAAVRLAPESAEAHTARGIVLAETGQVEDSLAALEEARRRGAAGKDYFHARAQAQVTLSDPTEALADLAQTLAIDPNDIQAHTNRAFLLLTHGDWRNGWADHEWRLKRRSHPHGQLRQSTPQWQGEDLAGKRLFVYTEQGYGDTIQFVRYLRLLEGRGASITFGVPEVVRRLFVANFPGIDVTDVLGVRHDFDYQISLMSMPFAFGTTPETVPQNVPYLFADEERAAKWKARLGSEGFRVGVVWQGNPKYGRDRHRSLPLARFAPLVSVPGVRLISLQTGRGADQLRDLPANMKVEELGEEIVNNPDGFREVAAVMANLDLLVMSDTGPTHLAGALGLPVWMALAHEADWRWMRDREDTPWYPTMRLFRQATAGDWPGLFKRLTKELAGAVERRRR